MPKDNTIINKNFQALRGELRPMDVDNAVKFIRTTSMMPMRIRVGGFNERTDYGFKSFGVHPYHRSFSIQGGIAVIMGWPVTNSGTHCMSLHQLRYQFQRHNILHKYHKTDGDIDNDLYFVVGRVSSNIVNTALKRQGEERLRAYLASIEPITIPLTHEDISIVCYSSDLLPQNTSVCLPITGESLDGLQSMLSINGSLSSLAQEGSPHLGDILRLIPPEAYAVASGLISMLWCRPLRVPHQLLPQIATLIKPRDGQATAMRSSERKAA